MMMKIPLRKHCTDEQLLGHLDGELAPWLERSVARHLRSCWECRRPLSELEVQIESLSQLLEHPEDLQRRAQAAEFKFRAWQAQFEQDLGSAPRFRLLSGTTPRKQLALALSLVLMCLLGLAFWIRERLAPPQPSRILAQTRQYEQQFYREAVPIHHTFQVEVVEIEPRRLSRSSRVKIWSKPDEGRYAARWEDSSGMLKHALWRPDPRQEYTYDSSQAAAIISRPASPPEAISLMELSRFGLEAEQIEAGFLKWIFGQRWRPISLAADFIAFSNQEGVVLQAMPFSVADEPPAIRLSARKRSGDLSIEVVMDVDARSYRPRFQTVRFANGYRTVELRLRPVRTETVASYQSMSALFEPDVPIRPQDRRATIARLTSPTRRGSDVPQINLRHLEETGQSPVLEIKARYALHRIRACLGEPIEILPQPSGRLMVRGTAKTEDRKQEILAALQPLVGLTVEIQTIEEALAASKASGAGGSGDSEPTGNVTDSAEIRARHLPIQSLLEEYFSRRHQPGRLKGSQKDPALVGAEITGLANQAISLSQKAWLEGWALRRLIERYPSSKVHQLQADTHWLLEAMIREHLSELKSHSAASRLLLEPVLSSLLHDKLSTGVGLEDRFSSVPLALETDLAALSLQLVTICEQSKKLTYGLFAGIDLGAGQEEQAMRSLLVTLTGLDQELHRLEEAVPKVFSAKTSWPR
jgi:hypothetical protein